MERITTKGHRSRRMVASYGSYAEAQEAVDRLTDEGFPVERLSIVAERLRFEEGVTGRKGYGRSVLEGLGAGNGVQGRGRGDQGLHRQCLLRRPGA